MSGFSEQNAGQYIVVDNPIMDTDRVSGRVELFNEDGSPFSGVAGGELPFSFYSGNHIFGPADAGSIVYGTSRYPQTFTIPKGVFPIGTLIQVCQYDIGQVTIGNDPQVNLRSYMGYIRTNNRYAFIRLHQTEPDIWVLNGNTGPQLPPPAITSFAPNSASIASGAPLTVVCTGDFRDPATADEYLAITSDGSDVWSSSPVTVDSPTQVTAHFPDLSGAVPGPGHVYFGNLYNITGPVFTWLP